jgi:hypothetical protein
VNCTTGKMKLPRRKPAALLKQIKTKWITAAMTTASATSLMTLLRMISRDSRSHVARPIKKNMPGRSNRMIAIEAHAIDMGGNG